MEQMLNMQQFESHGGRHVNIYAKTLGFMDATCKLTQKQVQTVHDMHQNWFRTSTFKIKLQTKMKQPKIFPDSAVANN